MDIYDTLRGLLELLGEVFLRLVNVSIAAGVMILAVALIRRVFPKMPKWLCCLLWALPALRLLSVSITNPYSIAPNAETVYEVRAAVADMGGVSVPVLNSGIEAVDNAVNPALERTFVAATQSAAAVTGTVRDFDPSDWFGLLWAAGCAVMLAYLLVSYLRFRRKVRPCVPYEKGVYLTDGVSAPFILGLLRPRVYLPSALPEVHYPAILAHERAHLKRRDHWWKPLGFLLLAVHWFNPLVWLGYRLLCRDIEFACDEKVIRDADPAAKKAYSEALLACGAPLKGTSACPLAFGEVGVKARIKRVLRYKKPAVWIAAVALLAAAVAAFFFLTDRPGHWEKEWNSEFVTGRVYLDSVVSPQKASREPPRTVILDEENHLVIRHANGASYDYGPADISGEYLWDYVKDYVPAQYRNSRPAKSPEAVSVDPYRGSGYARHFVIFRPRGNVFFFAVIAQTPEGYSAESVCRLTRKGDYVREDKAPHWYFIVPVEGVRHIEVTGDFGRGLTSCSHANEDDNSIAFDTGERVFLRCLDGFTSMGGLSFKAFDRAGGEIFSFNAPVIGDWNLPEENRWGVARLEEDDPVLLSEQSVAMQFLTRWFTPDYEGRYTRLLSEIRGGNLNEKASDSYFSAIRPCVTEEYYKKIVMNRGYHSYDKNAAENDLTNRVRIPSVRLNYNGDGTYAFKVYLDRNFDGAVAVGTLRFKDGKVDGMYVNDCTLGKERRGGGETPTSYYYEDEGGTTAPPEEFSTAAAPGQARVERPFADWLGLEEADEAVAERALQTVGKTVETGGISVTVRQVLTYTLAVCIYTEITFPEEYAAYHDLTELQPVFTFAAEDMPAENWTKQCDVRSTGNDTTVCCFFMLISHQKPFTPDQTLSLAVEGFTWRGYDTVETAVPDAPFRLSWKTEAIQNAGQVRIRAADGMTGEIAFTPVCMRVSELKNAPYASWAEMLRDCRLTDAAGNSLVSFDASSGVEGDGPLSGAVSFRSFVDPERVKYLWLGGQRFHADVR